MGNATTCYYQYTGSAPTTFIEFASGANEGAANSPTSYSATTAASCVQWFPFASANTAIAATSRSVNSTGGWIPINLSLISSGAPIGQWPADPAYSAGGSATCAAGTCNGQVAHFYSYETTSTNNAYKLAAKMESALYSATGTSDLESTDGGTDQNMYEQGTNLTL